MWITICFKDWVFKKINKNNYGNLKIIGKLNSQKSRNLNLGTKTQIKPVKILIFRVRLEF